VNSHVASPLSNGLFRAAISESAGSERVLAEQNCRHWKRARRKVLLLQNL
jgi:hypothetical protein